MADERLKRKTDFLLETIDYFTVKLSGVDRDRYFAERDIRSILDKTINDIVLCMVDICEEVLKMKKRAIPQSYRDTVLACHEFLGPVALAVAPLVRHRNEMVHEYLKINWSNIAAVQSKIEDLREFVRAAVGVEEIDRKEP